MKIYQQQWKTVEMIYISLVLEIMHYKSFLYSSISGTFPVVASYLVIAILYSFAAFFENVNMFASVITYRRVIATKRIKRISALTVYFIFCLERTDDVLLYSHYYWVHYEEIALIIRMYAATYVVNTA